MIRAAQLYVKMQIQKPVETRTSTGEIDTQWTTVATRMVQLISESESQGRDLFNAGVQQLTSNVYRGVLRWEKKLKDLTPKWRMRQDTCLDRVFQIEAVVNVQNRSREYSVRLREYWNVIPN